MVHKTQNKSYTTFSRHRDRLESLFVEVCFVCVSVFVYTIVIGLIQKLTEVLIDILNTNIKVWVTKYKLFIFMATTQLESGSFMVGMNHDCKSASMNCVWKALPSPLPQREKNLYKLLTPWPLTWPLNFYCTWYLVLLLFLLHLLWSALAEHAIAGYPILLLFRIPSLCHSFQACT